MDMAFSVRLIAGARGVGSNFTPASLDRTRIRRRTGHRRSRGKSMALQPHPTGHGPSQSVGFVPQCGTRPPEESGRMRSLTELIQKVADGDLAARDDLFAAAYSELRKLARSRLRDGGRNTFLETTALVHESYLRFVKVGELRIEDRSAFFAYASRVMRSVIVDAVRERQAQRRGGELSELTLDTQVAAELPRGDDEVLRVHEALL